MKTLKELLEGVELPVKVKLVVAEFSNHNFIEIVAKNDYGAVGFSGSKSTYKCDFRSVDGSSYWEFYTEPKPKQTWYEYLVDHGRQYRVCEWYKRDIDFLDCNPNETIIKTGRSIELEQVE